MEGGVGPLPTASIKDVAAACGMGAEPLPLAGLQQRCRWGGMCAHGLWWAVAAAWAVSASKLT